MHLRLTRELDDLKDAETRLIPPPKPLRTVLPGDKVWLKYSDSEKSRRRKDFDIARGFRHEVVDGVFVVRDVIETTYGGKYGDWGDFQYKKREFSIQDIILYHVMHYVSSISCVDADMIYRVDDNDTQ